MIIRKPYAFLIKHFKLIHLLLAGLYIYLAFRTNALREFIEYYQAEGWVSTFSFSADTYIDAYLFLAIIVSVIICAIVLLLMKRKEKPTVLYIFNIVAYLVFFLLFILSYAILISMETETIDTRTISMIADLNLTSFLIQCVVIIFALVRGLGFDIKKFDFGEDIEQLKIEMADNEEVEVSMKVDTDNVFASLRKQKREFKYLYQENAFIINIFGALFAVVLILVLYLNIAIYHKVYREDETFRAGNFNIDITGSYITTKDYKEKRITSKDNSYVIVKFKITNITKVDQAFNIKNYRLIAGSSNYTVTVNQYNQLFDIGYGYRSETIKAGVTKEYMVAYLVDDRSLSNRLYVRYKNSINYYSGKFVANYKKARLSTENLDSKETAIAESKLTKTLTFKDSLLNDTTINIKSYEIAESFVYSYQYCINKKCLTNQDIIKPASNNSYNKTVMALDTTLVLGELVSLRDTESTADFITKLSYLTYEIDGVVKTHPIALVNCTPYAYTGSVVYLEVLDEVKTATKVNLVFDLRNKIYTYNLK